MKRTKKLMKKISVVSLILLTTTLATATLISFFGSVEITLNVSQPIKLDGHRWDVPIHEQINAVGGYTTYSNITHVLSNSGPNNRSYVFNINGEPDLVGINISIVDPITHAPVSFSPLYSMTNVSFVFRFEVSDLIEERPYNITATLVLA